MRRSNNTNTAKLAGKAAGKPGRFAQKALVPKVLALVLAVLLIFACAATAFAKSGDSVVTFAKSSGTYLAKSGDGDTATESITTIGADAPTGAPDCTGQSATMDGSENSNSEDGGQTDPETERRKEIYTFMTLIALGAIIVGIREKRSKRRY
ncbi:MAG: hypothetical protein IKI73_00110 [Firmicutes bacterium]|nr:hypothetical protein [Bacillota bacterium]